MHNASTSPTTNNTVETPVSSAASTPPASRDSAKRRSNDVGGVNFLDPRLPDRFWKSAVPVPFSGCWLWTASTRDGEYGQVHYKGRNTLAHRAFYDALVGGLSPDLVLDHVCRVQPCVNPAHLEQVTQLENIRRGLPWLHNNRSKTHCPRGHAYAGDNLVINNRGERVCRACERVRNARRRASV